MLPYCKAVQSRRPRTVSKSGNCSATRERIPILKRKTEKRKMSHLLCCRFSTRSTAVGFAVPFLFLATLSVAVPLPWLSHSHLFPSLCASLERKKKSMQTQVIESLQALIFNSPQPLSTGPARLTKRLAQLAALIFAVCSCSHGAVPADQTAQS